MALLYKKAKKNENHNSDENVGCLLSICYCMLIVGLSVVLSAIIIFSVNDMFALVKADVSSTIILDEDDTIADFAELLSQKGIIKNKSLFRLYSRVSGNSNNLAAGEYILSSSMDYRTLLRSVRSVSSSKVEITVTIPEGMEQEDIFNLLESSGICDAWKLKAFAKYYDFGYSFLENLPYSDTRLEGYLFPDTYIFYENDTPQRVLTKMLSNFKNKWNVDMKARLENINYSMREVLIIASMSEKEAKFDDERTVISSVIYNRLRSPDFPYLQIDATVQYALDERKEKLTYDDLKIDSPYNTYIVEGLPIGPICNPGYAAIYAALYPLESNYYYYVARPSGYHLFAETYSEHLENINIAERERAELNQ